MEQIPADAPRIRAARQRRGLQNTWILVGLLSLWLAIELGRPSNPLRLPLLCSLILGVAWLSTPRKRWDPAIRCCVGFLLVGWLGVPLAANQYAAFWTSYALSIVVLCIGLPAAHFLDTLKQLKFFIATFLVVSGYVGLFAATHSGFGPAGSRGGQDENYVAAAMCAALPFAYFGLSAARRIAARIFLIAAAVTSLLAIVIGSSRGGFLGLSVVGLFCFLHAPRKWVAAISVVCAAAILFAVAPARYWKDVESIGDTKEATADMRIELWTIATREFLHNPILGVGPGNFLWNIEKYQSDEQVEKFGRSLGGSAMVHSTYFEVLSELGAAGFALFSGMIFFTYREMRRIVRQCELVLGRRKKVRGGDVEWTRALALGFQGGLAGYLVCSAFLSTTYFSMIWVLCTAAVALRHVSLDVLAVSRPVRSRSVQKSSRPGEPGDEPGSERPESRRPPRVSDLIGQR